ncbi:hypothetical protein HPP92_021340 [Vanilla planifolia]|uniref:Uncharacterized protein n=1 Tax=Vanilla planifolia TaxID=51239 RepID=A0A835Q1S5_VANPL|nr:hypothetical protein HPP92_021340 [Vanilla planifolia]
MRQDRGGESPETLTFPQRIRRPSDDDHWKQAESPRQISAAPTATSVDEAEEEEEEFEFAFVVKDTETGLTADEIFSEGQIRPIYPIFNRSLLVTAGEISTPQPLGGLILADRKRSISSSSSSTSLGEELEGIPPGTYCVWKPGSAVRKSSSMGSSFRWRFRDLVLGRSHSDGDKFHYLTMKEKNSPEKEAPAAAGGMMKAKKATEIDLTSVHRMYYGKNGMSMTGGGSVRKSYLPYKPSVVGLFGGGSGLSRVHHPV